MISTLILMSSDSSIPKQNSCLVCLEKYTKSIRKAVVCPYCRNQCCADCSKNYLTSSIHEAHCMFCKVGWNEEFLRDTFSNNWLTKVYSTIEASNLWEREKSLMPNTQLRIEREQFVKEFNAHHRIALRQRARTMIRELQNLDVVESTVNGSDPIMNLYQSYKRWTNPQFDKSLPLIPDFSEEHMNKLFLGVSEDQQKRTKAAFVKPCPAPDCRGFLSTQWKCGICSTKVCPHCHVITRLGEKDKENATNLLVHECSKEDLATAELIAKDSKNCPKCGVIIQKSEGCNQMWCTNCNTAFNWKTLEIINGNIHNPHYFEWSARMAKLRDGGTSDETPTFQAPAGLCNENQRLDGASISNNLSSCLNVNKRAGQTTAQKQSLVSISNKIINFVRVVLHVSDYQLHGRASLEVFDTTSNEFVRYAYLKQQISEEKAKELMFAKYKKYRFENQRRQILQMLNQACSSVLAELMNRPACVTRGSTSTDDELQTWLITLISQLDAVRTLYNDSINNHYNRYKSHAGYLVIDPISSTSNFRFVHRSSK